MSKVQETSGVFSLTLGEETYSQQFAQNPKTARRLQSLIPATSGELTREKGEPLFFSTVLPGPVGSLQEYQYNQPAGGSSTTWFAATSTQLFRNVENNWIVQTLPLPNGSTTTSPFIGYPSFVVINNLLHISDGTNNWIYDGPNNQYVLDGFGIPQNPPDWDNTNAGTFSCTVGVFYWITYSDQTSGRVHESSSSPISTNAGPVSNVVIKVYPGLKTGCNTTITSPTVTTATPAFVPSYVGYHLYVAGVDYGPIATFTNTQTIQLVTPAPANNTGALFVVAPARANHINFYRSESDGSKLGKFLTTMVIQGNTTPFISDQSPFQNQLGTTMLDIDRPVRNDPAPASQVMEVHKYRIWRRRDGQGQQSSNAIFPNRFNYTAYEEVLSGANGSPQESAPGTDALTLSDIIDETAYPKTAVAIRAMKSHNDALYIGTEKEIIPLWGDTIGQFALSQVTAVDGGVISRWGMESLSHGLAIFSYDRKLYIYPPVSPIFALTPQELNVTDQLIEIGRPMRNKFLSILASDIQNVRILKYRYNIRDWLVICYQDNTNVYHTYVYDFETKGWFELQKGFVSIGVFEPSPGVKVLVGGGTDGKVYVLDDVTDFYSSPLTLPPAIFRTALMDFGHPDLLHQLDYIEVEVSNPALMDSSTTINFYLDPIDADNPGTPIQVSMSPVFGETNRYRGFFSASEGGTGTICRRAMIECLVASDTNSGSFRGIIVKADPISGMLR